MMYNLKKFLSALLAVVMLCSCLPISFATEIPANTPVPQETVKEEPKQEAPRQEPKTEEPKQESKTEESKQEPKTEEPKQESKSEEPKTEEPKTEEPKTEEPKQEESKQGDAGIATVSEEPADETKSDEVKSDEVKSDETKSDEVKSEETKSEEVKSDEVKSDETKSDEIIEDEIIEDEIIEDEIIEEEPVIESGDDVLPSDEEEIIEPEEPIADEIDAAAIPEPEAPVEQPAPGREMATVEWSNTTVTFNAKAQKPTAKLVSMYGDLLEENLSVSCSGGDAIDAGTYTFTADVSEYEDAYSINDKIAYFTIEKYDAAIYIQNTSKTYSEEDSTSGKCDLTHIHSDNPDVWRDLRDLIGSNNAITRAAGEDAGQYGYIYNFDTSAFNNYNITINNEQNGYLTINPLSQSITIANATKTIGKADPDAWEISSSLDSGIDADVLAGLITRESGETAGSYSFRLEYDSSVYPKLDNYAFSFTNSFVIEKVPARIVWENTAAVYNGKAQAPTAYLADANGDRIVDLPVIPVSGNEAINVYNVYLFDADISAFEADYEISGNTGCTFGIEPLPVSMKFTGSKYYGEPMPSDAELYAYDLISADPEALAIGEDQLRSAINSRYDFECAIEDIAGEHSIRLSSGGGYPSFGNYSLSAASGDCVYVIKPLPVTVTLNGSNKVVGNDDPADIYGYTLSGSNTALTSKEAELRGLIDANITFSREEGEEIGEYGYNYKFAPNSQQQVFKNYDLTINADAKFIIAEQPPKEPASIVWTNTEATYDQQAHAPAAYLADANGDKIADLTVSGNAGVNAGDYSFTADVSAYTDAYEISGETDVTMTIKPQSVSLSVDNRGKTYGHDDPEDWEVQSSALSPELKDILTDLLTREEGEAVGSYNFKLDYDPADYPELGNYDFSFSYMFVIEPVITKVKILPHTLVYGQEITNPEVEVSSRYPGYPELGLTPAAKAELEEVLKNAEFVTHTTIDGAGEYKYRLINFDNDNFTIDLDNTAPLTILPAKVSLRTVSAIKTYGEPDPDIASFYALDFAEGHYSQAAEAELRSLIAAKGAVSREAGEDATYYSYDVIDLETDPDFGNFEIMVDNNPNMFFIINPASVNVVIEAAEKTYGEDNPAFAWRLEGHDEGSAAHNEFAANYTIGYENGEGVGEHAYVLIPSEDADGNYEFAVSPDSGAFTIAAKTVEVTVESASTVYLGNFPRVEWSLEGYDENSPEYQWFAQNVTIGSESTDAGVHDYSLTDNSNNSPYNFVLSDESGRLTIDPLPISIAMQSDDKYFGTADPYFNYNLITDEAYASILYNNAVSIRTLIDDNDAIKQPGVNVGEYDYDLSGLTGAVFSNFAFTDATPDGVKFTIKPVDVELLVKASKEYGESDIKPVILNCILLPDIDNLRSSLTEKVYNSDFTFVRDPGEEIGKYNYTDFISSDPYFDNFNIEITGALEIGQANIEVTFDDASIYYGEDMPELTYTLSPASDEIEEEFRKNYTPYCDFNGVGEYSILLSKGADASENYRFDVSPFSGKLTVDRLPVKIISKDVKKFYGEDDPKFVFDLVSEECPEALANVKEELEAALNANNIIKREPGEDAGIYKLIGDIGFGDYPNFSVGLFTDSHLTIKPLPVEIAIKNGSKVYMGEEPDYVYTLSSENHADVLAAKQDELKGLIDDNQVISREQGDDADEYGFVLQNTVMLGNYSLSISGNPVFTIDPFKATAVVTGTKVYGDTDEEAAFTIDAFIDFPERNAALDQLKGLLESNDVVYLRDPGEDAGIYKLIGITVGDAFKNYDLSAEGILQILPLEATVVIEAASKYYGQDDPQFKYTLTDIPDDKQDIAKAEFDANYQIYYEGEDADSYFLTFEKLSNASENFQFDLSASSGLMTILRLPVTLTTKDMSKVYGEEEPVSYNFDLSSEYPDVLAKFEGELKKQLIEENVISRKKNENVGEYIYKGMLTVSNYPNFEITFNNIGKFTISKRPAVIKMLGADKYYDADEPVGIFDFTLEEADGSELSVEFRDELLPLIKDHVTFSRDPGEDVGTYGYDAKYDAADFANFDLKFEEAAADAVEGNFIIKPLPVKLTMNRMTKTYGGNEPSAYEYKVEILKNVKDEKLSKDKLCALITDHLPISREPGENKGKYAYVIGDPDEEIFRNYDLTIDKTNEFQIYPMPVTIHKQHQTKVYGQNDPGDFHLFGLTSTKNEFNQDRIDELTELIKEYIVFTRVGGEAVGKYNFNIPDFEIAELGNFSIAVDEASFTEAFEITKLPVVLSIDELIQKTYGDTDPDITQNYLLDGGDYLYAAKEAELRDLIDAKNNIFSRSGDDNVGVYDFIVENYNVFDNYEVILDADSCEGKFEIVKLAATISMNGATKIYGQDDPGTTFDYTLTAVNANEADLLTALDTELRGLIEDYVVFSRIGGENVGTYAYEASYDDASFANYDLEFVAANETDKFHITPLQLVVEMIGADKLYGQKDPENTFNYNLVSEDEAADALLAKEDELRGLIDNPANGVKFTRETSEGDIVGDYKYSITGLDGAAFSNYVLTDDCTAVFTINKLPVTLTMNGSEKFYGDVDPVDIYEYELAAEGEAANEGLTAKEDELRGLISGLAFKRLKDGEIENGETAGSYTYVIEGLDGLTNYTVSTANMKGAFVINPLNVVLSMVGSSKQYGSVDPDNIFDYTLSTADSEAALAEVETEIRAAIDAAGTGFIFQRTEGETIGKYDYTVGTPANGLSPDFVVTVDTASLSKTFEIKPIEAAVTGSVMDSRTDNFTFTVPFDGDTLDSVPVKYTITASNLNDANRLGYGASTGDYLVNNATGTISLNKENNVHKITVTPQTLKHGEGEGAFSWDVYFPAGTVLTISLTDEANNKIAEDATITVGKHSDDLTIGGGTNANALVGGKYMNPTTLSGGPNEVVSVILNGTQGYYQLDGEGNLALNTLAGWKNSDDNASTEYTIEANYVDAGNIGENHKSTFGLDNKALPVQSISFENRGRELTVVLAEPGENVQVTIAGVDPSLITPIGGNTTDNLTFRFNVAWTELIHSSSTISVTYTDAMGYSGSGTGRPSKSSVSAPITMKIKPALNEHGYLGGSSSKLIIFGTGCGMEPITAVISDLSKSTVIEKVGAEWSASAKGTWQITVDTSRLPQGVPFLITVNYDDVIGSGAQMTVIFDAECMDSVITTPIHEGMETLAGVVEPNSAVYLYIGDSAYEIEVDRHGRFVMTNFPYMFENESFKLRITDIAGNVIEKTYTIPAITYDENSFSYISTKIYPLGAIFADPDLDNEPYWAMATPVRLSDLENGDLVLPLLAGAAYNVGELTISKAEGGISVSSQLSEALTAVAENIVVDEANSGLYIYREQPDCRDMKNRTGEKAAYGDAIAIGEDETIWICSEIIAEILMDEMYGLVTEELETNELYIEFNNRMDK